MKQIVLYQDFTPVGIAEYIIEAWQKVYLSGRPWGVWVSAHEDLDPDSSDIKTAAYQVWFLDKTDYHKKTIWEYARFYSIHFDAPWSKGIMKVPSGLFDKRSRGLGIASFAQFRGSHDFLIETLFNTLSGEGVRVTCEADNPIKVLDRIWIS